MGDWSISEELEPWLHKAFAMAGLTLEARQEAGPHKLQLYTPFQIAEMLLKAHKGELVIIHKTRALGKSTTLANELLGVTRREKQDG